MAADNPDRVSDDISRVVDYLNTKRSGANERTHGLAHEIAHRREASSGPKENGPLAEAQPVATRRPMAAASSTSAPTGLVANPLLTERYHAFCRDVDVLLDSFRARVEHNKPIKH